jgi:hypothetical protein
VGHADLDALARDLDTARRYMGVEILAKTGGAAPISAGAPEEVNAIQAISA